MTRLWIGTTLAAIFLGGCSCTGPAPVAVPPATTKGGIRVRSLEELPPVGDRSPPIDDNRLEAAPPQGWTVLPRPATSLIAFVPKRGQLLPRITINAQDPPAEVPEELTEENVSAFVTWLEEDLRASGKVVWEEGLPSVLGDTLFVRHVRHVRDASDTPLVLQSLQTIKGRRLYTVDLIVEIDAHRAEDYEESLRTWRDQGYAVAANMRFAPAGERLDPLDEFRPPPGPEATGEQPQNADAQAEPDAEPELGPDPEP